MGVQSQINKAIGGLAGGVGLTTKLNQSSQMDALKGKLEASEAKRQEAMSRLKEIQKARTMQAQDFRTLTEAIKSRGVRADFTGDQIIIRAKRGKGRPPKVQPVAPGPNDVVIKTGLEKEK